MKIKAISTGAPPLIGAEAFARLLVAMVEKKPVLRVVNSEKSTEPKPSTSKENKLGINQ